MDCRLLSWPLVDLLAPTPQAYAPLAFLSSRTLREVLSKNLRDAGLR